MAEKQKVRQSIEEGIQACLDGERKANALQFTAYLRDQGLNPIWASPLSWKIIYKNQCVCYIKLFTDGRPGYNNRTDGDWMINPHGGFPGGYGSVFNDDPGKEIAWANIKHCIGCSQKCVKGKMWRSVSVLGRTFDQVCKYVTFAWANPGADAIVYIKKMIVNRCNEIKPMI